MPIVTVYQTDIDCDDNDPYGNHYKRERCDCDGVPTDIDCDDNDPTVTTTNEEATLYCPDPISGSGIRVVVALKLPIQQWLKSVMKL